VQESSLPEDSAGSQNPESRGPLRARVLPSRRLIVELAPLIALAAGAAACCAAFSFLTLFSTFESYDDEGKMLLYVQHLLDGHVLYDQVHCPYGPAYFLSRWLFFSVLGLPLTHDVTALLTLAAWWITVGLLAASAARLAAGTGWASEAAVLVAVAATIHLRVFCREPGHPQELTTALLAAAVWIAATESRRRTALFMLGGIGGLMLFTKINIGVFFGVALAASVLSLLPRPGLFWQAVRASVALGGLALPSVLMRSRFDQGFLPFCLLITISLLPCCFAIFRKKERGTIAAANLIICGLGVLATSTACIGFALWHGSTVNGMLMSLIIRPASEYGGPNYGSPLLLANAMLAWSVCVALIGMIALSTDVLPAMLLLTLRSIYIGATLAGVFTATFFDGWWLGWALPLTWLILVPLFRVGPSDPNPFVRILLAFSICLQALQIYPMPAGQVHYGSLLMVLGAVTALRDLWQARGSFIEWKIPHRVMRTSAWLATVAPIFILGSTRTCPLLGKTWILPSLTCVWALVGATAAALALWASSRRRLTLWPLRLVLACAFLGIALFGHDDAVWVGRLLPLMWIVFAIPQSSPVNPFDWLARVLIVAACCLHVAGNLFPMSATRNLTFHGTDFQAPVFVVLMLIGGALLLHDTHCEIRSQRGQTAPISGGVLKLAFVSLAIVLSLRATWLAAEKYLGLEPVALAGSHGMRMSEKDKSFYEFVTANVRFSSDCFVPRFGLASVYFWAAQRPASNVIIGNLWEGMDRSEDDALLEAHRDRLQMMFIDTPNPWRPDTPKTKFLSYVQGHFRTLARVGTTRFLVRKERTDLELFDCAFQPKAGGAAPNILCLRLPSVPKLDAVAAITLVDLDQHQELASTSGEQSERKLVLKDAQGRTLLPSRSRPAELPAPGRDFRLSFPTAIRLEHAGYPALRFFDGNGLRLLTLPVALEAEVPIR
jgi:hypothetical protein